MSIRKFWLSKEVLLTFAFTAFLVVPFVVFGGTKAIYVDKDASGNEDGTSDHPYHSISKALDHTKDGTEVRVKSGTYKENITIPKDVKVMGDDGNRDNVTIKADNDDKPAVTMKNGAELNAVTVKGGRHGIRIVEDAKAHIYDVTVKDSLRDGIHIDAADTDKKHRVLIDTVAINDNARAGIFSEKRFIVVINSDMLRNGSDGIDLAADTEAWLENNRINANGGSGAKLILDGSSIYGKKNGFRNNEHEGMEVNAYGAAGTIELKRSAFVNNDHYGVARLARTASGTTVFGNLSFGSGVNASRFLDNHNGDISSVIRGF